MTTVTTATGHTITTEVRDVVIPDRVGFLDMSRTEKRRVASVFNADGVYENGVIFPNTELSLDEDEALKQIQDSIDELMTYYVVSGLRWCHWTYKQYGKVM